MKENLVFNNEQNKPIVRDEVLKATSLLYFKEALLKERYEDCAELVWIAKGFGAQQSEISGVIAESNRGAKAGRVNEADQNIGGRLRFY